jgi:hypothetical protein
MRGIVTQPETQPETEIETQVTRRRGRPRPAATIERDAQVLAQLQGQPSTRAELVEKIDATSGQIYLSLFRLRQVGHAQRSRLDGRHVWHVAGDPTAAPE